MVDAHDFEHVCALAIVDTIGRNGPGPNASAVAQNNFSSDELFGGQETDDLDHTGQQSVSRLGIVPGDRVVGLGDIDLCLWSNNDLHFERSVPRS